MKKIAEVVNPLVDINSDKRHTRQAARGIIKRDGKVLLVYSSHFDDYMIPGGGIEYGESKEESLLRELKEEAGAIEPYVIKELGYIEEFHKSKQPNLDLFYQKSYYYLCEAKGFGELNLEDYEVRYGYEVRWIDIKEAIHHNKLQIEQGNESTSKKRAITILEYLLKNGV